MTQGDRIAKVRSYFELSQEEFGNQIGVTELTVRLIEKNKSELTKEMIVAICTKFNVDFIWLTSGNGPMIIDNNIQLIDLIERNLAGEDEYTKLQFRSFLKSDPEILQELSRVLDDFIEENSKILTIYSTKKESE